MYSEQYNLPLKMLKHFWKLKIIISPFNSKIPAEVNLEKSQLLTTQPVN